MRFKIRGLRAAALFAVTFTGGALRAADPRTAGTTLLELIDARVVGLGESGTALGGELGGVAVNPALSVTYTGSQVSSQFQTAAGDVNTGFLVYGRSGLRFGWSAALAFLDAGKIEVVPLSGPTRSLSAQRDYVGSLTAAVALGDRLRVGAAVKGIHSTLVEDFTATAPAFDAGLLFDITSMLRLGVAAQNLGSELVYESEGDPLPTRYRAGLALQFPEDDQTLREGQTPWYMRTYADQSFFTITADAVSDRWGTTTGAVGFEWDRTRLAVLRLGGQFGQDAHAFSAGVGFWIQSWRFDYGYQWVDELEDRHRATLSYFWRTSPERRDEKHMNRRFNLRQPVPKPAPKTAPKKKRITPF